MPKPSMSDACPKGAGGFSSDLDYWWVVEWPQEIFERTLLPSTDKHFIPNNHLKYSANNHLKYSAYIFGLAGTILSWEQQPPATRPLHPLMLLWTDNMTAYEWTKKIAGIKAPQGRVLARILAHLLMFSDLGIEAKHIESILNIIADFRSWLTATHELSLFTYSHLQTKFSWLMLSLHFTLSSKLLALICSALLKAYVQLPTTRVKLGQLIIKPATSTQPLFHNSS
jgi:hypothetical protein